MGKSESLKKSTKGQSSENREESPPELGLTVLLKKYWQYTGETMVGMPGNKEEQRRGGGFQSISHPGAQLFFSRSLNKATSVLVSDRSFISCVPRSVAASWEDKGRGKNG